MSPRQSLLSRISRSRVAINKLYCDQVRTFHPSAPSRSASADPRAIADAFLARFAGGQTFVRRQLLDANQLRLFSLTLNRAHLWPRDSLQRKSLEAAEPAEGTPVPPGYHLAYFTPAQLPGILGLDGTDASFNPDPPFTRRMWAGGSVHWPNIGPSNGPTHCLCVGDVGTEITKVVSCEPKTIKKTGESMLVVGVEKEFRDSKDNLCVVDRRNWVFRGELDPTRSAAAVLKPPLLSDAETMDLEKGKMVRHFNRDVATLFRFSALTFNAHRIHYDLPWARQVEGHRNVVVHGPMNLVSMLDMWRDDTVERALRSSREDVVYPQQIEYRATSPVYAGEGYRILMHSESVDSHEAQMTVVSDDGTVCMKGSITDWS